MTTTSTRSKKIRAITAGGAVLGLGAVITLAAWSDSEFAQGEFRSGTFGIEASADQGTNWADYTTTGDPLVLTPETGAETLSPDETVAYPYTIRKIDGAVDTTVTYVGASLTDAGADIGAEGILTTTVLQSDTCTPATSTADAGVTELAAGQTFNLTGTDASRTENLCIQVTLDGAYVQPVSQPATYSWEFEAAEMSQAAGS